MTSLVGLSLKQFQHQGIPMSASEPVNKSAFVRQFLADHPGSTPSAVIQAWDATGLEGSISASLVRGIRLKMKHSEKPAKVTASAAKKRKVKRTKRMVVKEVAEVKKIAAPKRVRAVSTKVTPTGNRRAELEAEIDRLLFKVMGLGGLTQTEDHLRKARRSLYEAK